MAHYRKRPIAIEAWQFNPDNDEPMPSWLQKALFVWPNAGGVQFENGGSGIKIQTLEGVMAASPSDWIIKGVKGELYCCRPDIFDETYEPAEDHGWKAVNMAPEGAVVEVRMGA